MLLGLSGIFFVLFGLAAWARIRQARPQVIQAIVAVNEVRHA